MNDSSDLNTFRYFYYACHQWHVFDITCYSVNHSRWRSGAVVHISYRCQSIAVTLS